MSNLDLKYMILTYTKDFSWKKINQNLSNFEKFFLQIARFYDQFKYVAKNIEGLCLFSTHYLIFRQIWLNYFVNDHHFGYITNSLKETLTYIHWKSNVFTHGFATTFVTWLIIFSHFLNHNQHKNGHKVIVSKLHYIRVE